MSDLCIVDPTPVETLPDIFRVLATPTVKFNATAEAHYEHTLSLFVRLGSNVISRARKVDLVVASVSNVANTRGRGTLKRLLGLLEPTHSIAFESVVNPRLARCLRERGYTPWPEDAVTEWDVQFWIRRKP